MQLIRLNTQINLFTLFFCSIKIELAILDRLANFLLTASSLICAMLFMHCLKMRFTFYLEKVGTQKGLHRVQVPRTEFDSEN